MVKENQQVKEESEKVLLNRYRFMQPTADYRPIKWPILYPYWCSGQTSGEINFDINILIAYAPNEAYILEYWPEAYEISEINTFVEINFTSRFPRPEWYKESESE